MTRYTASPNTIEVHLSDITEGMDTQGVDVPASNAVAAVLVEEAVRALYPEHDVSVFTMQTQGRWFEAAAWPDDVDPELMEAAASNAVGEDGSLWMMQTVEVARG